MKIDCNYDKTKLLHEMARLKWFINKHAIEDAEKVGHEQCKDFYKELEEDLNKHMIKLKELISHFSKRDEFH